MSSMTTELSPGEKLRVGEAEITLIEKRGQRCRIKISAPQEVKISRDRREETGAGVPHPTTRER